MDDEGLVAFLFCVEIGDEAGFSIFDGAEYDCAGGVDHMAKIRLRLRLRQRRRRKP